MSNERRIRLGELLIRAGLITELQLNAALAEQKKWGGRLGRTLVEMNFISEDILVKGLARLLGVPRADLDHIDVPDAVMQKFDPMDCQNRGYLPIQYRASDKRLTVAMVEVNDLALVDELRFKYGFVVQPAIVGERTLQKKAREIFYGESFDQGAVALEPAIKLVDNQGGTLVKHRDEIMAEAPAPTFRTTGVERTPPLPPPASAAPQLDDLEAAQKRQARAIKSVVELLVDKGVFTREEFLACVSAKTDQ